MTSVSITNILPVVYQKNRRSHNIVSAYSGKRTKLCLLQSHAAKTNCHTAC
jgi:hypothetical protein